MEADGETPWEACRREVREECGIEVRTGRLAAWTSAGRGPAGRAASGSCSTAGGWAKDALAGIVLQPEEISEYRLAALPDAFGLLRGPIRRRVRAAAGASAWSIWRMAARFPALASHPEDAAPGRRALAWKELALIPRPGQRPGCRSAARRRCRTPPSRPG